MSSMNARYYQIMARCVLSLGLYSFMLQVTTSALPYLYPHFIKGKNALQNKVSVLLQLNIKAQHNFRVEYEKQNKQVNRELLSSNSSVSNNE